MLKVKYKIVIPGAKKQGITFKEGLDPGVIAEETVTFANMNPEELTPHDGLAIVDHGEKLRDDNIEIEIEDVE